MIKRKRSLVAGLTVVLIGIAATPAFSGSINLKDSGVALWIFILTGAVIVLFQFIPAAILFFSFLGTISLIVFKLKEVFEELPAKEKVVLPGYEPTTIKKNRRRSERYEM